MGCVKPFASMLDHASFKVLAIIASVFSILGVGVLTFFHKSNEAPVIVNVPRDDATLVARLDSLIARAGELLDREIKDHAAGSNVEPLPRNDVNQFVAEALAAIKMLGPNVSAAVQHLAGVLQQRLDALTALNNAPGPAVPSVTKLANPPVNTRPPVPDPEPKPQQEEHGGKKETTGPPTGPVVIMSKESTPVAKATPPPPPPAKKAVASPCDLNHDGTVDGKDVAIVVNGLLSGATGPGDLNQNGMLDAVDVQRVANASRGEGCLTGPDPPAATNPPSVLGFQSK